MNRIILIVAFMFFILSAGAQLPEDYKLWLGYERIGDPQLEHDYRRAAASVFFEKDNDMQEAARTRKPGSKTS